MRYTGADIAKAVGMRADSIRSWRIPDAEKDGRANTWTAAQIRRWLAQNRPALVKQWDRAIVADASMCPATPTSMAEAMRRFGISDSAIDGTLAAALNALDSALTWQRDMNAGAKGELRESYRIAVAEWKKGNAYVERRQCGTADCPGCAG